MQFTHEETTLEDKRKKAYETLLGLIGDYLRKGEAIEHLYQEMCNTLFQAIPHYSWVGIYALQGSDLLLKAFSGPQESPHARIPLGEGICGLAAKSGEIFVVSDVSKNSNYVPCFESTKSEIVVPIKYIDKVFGEIDVDSNQLDAFSPEDKVLLGMVADQLAAVLQKQSK